MHPPSPTTSPPVDPGHDARVECGDRPDAGGAHTTPVPGHVRRRWVWGTALAAYTVLVAAVLLWPSTVDRGAHDDIGATLATLYALGLPRWVDYDVIESAANVAMFVPLGFLLTRLTASRWWGLVAPVALSGAGELAQHLVRPERFATWADVAANTVGAALGVLAAVAYPRMTGALLRGRGTPGSTASRLRRARSPRPAPSATR